MKRLCVALCLTTVLALLLATSASAARPNPTKMKLPTSFSHIGAPVHSFTTASGHVVHYVDQGKKSWRTLVLVGGAGTGVQAFELTEFTRALRNKLNIRVVCVERNGFGMTEFEPADADGEIIPHDAGDAALDLGDPVKTREMYGQNVLEVLDHLGINKFSVLGISGGGPYTGEIARQAGARLRSVHFAVAVNQSAPGLVYPDPTFLAAMRSYIINPMVWWDMTGTTADMIPGWQERAYEEASWSAFVRGQDADPHAVAMDYTILQMTAPDVSMVTAPVFTYYGAKDPSVPYAERDKWVAAFTSSRKITQRNYPDRVHDVQYRHYDQILLDVAGYGDYRIIGFKGQTRVIPQAKWPSFRKRGAILGIWAWKNAKPPVD